MHLKIGIFLFLTLNSHLTTIGDREILKTELLKSAKLTPASRPILVSLAFDRLKLVSFVKSEENDLNYGPNARFTLKIHQMWSSETAKWNPSEYNNVENLVLNSQEIWTPDFLHISSLDGVPETLNPGPDDHVTLYSDGSLDRAFYARVRTPCHFTTTTTTDQSKKGGGDIKEEGVVCTMVYGSAKDTVENLKFGLDKENNTTLEAVTLNSGVSTQTLQINEIQNFTENDDSAKFSRLILIVNLTKTLAPKFESAFFGPIVLPCIVFSLLILLQFLIPPNIGERVVYGILLLIFMMLFFYFVTDFTNRTTLNDGFWTLPSVYIFCLILGAAAALTNTCLVVNFYHTKHNVVMGDKVKSLFLTWLPRALCMTNAADDVERRMFDKRQSTKRRRVSDSEAIQATFGAGQALLPETTGQSSTSTDQKPASVQVSRWSATFLQTAWLREIARDVRELGHTLNVRLAERRGSPQWTHAARVLNRFGFLTVGIYLILCHLVAIIVYACS